MAESSGAGAVIGLLGVLVGITGLLLRMPPAEAAEQRQVLFILPPPEPLESFLAIITEDGIV